MDPEFAPLVANESRDIVTTQTEIPTSTAQNKVPTQQIEGLVLGRTQTTANSALDASCSDHSASGYRD